MDEKTTSGEPVDTSSEEAADLAHPAAPPVRHGADPSDVRTDIGASTGVIPSSYGAAGGDEDGGTRPASHPRETEA